MGMGSGFKVGRIFGVNIRIDWSWIFIFLLVTWNLSVVFGQTHPAWTAGLVWGLAAVDAFLFFLSVLAHELAHSLTAKAYGIPVRSITLFLFGGVSNIQREPPSAVSELFITVVGPLTSIVIGGILIFLASLGMPSFQLSLANPGTFLANMSPLDSLTLWLGSINVLVGLFNLVPAFPLDGGRLVRSILWAITDNLRQATLWASWLGRLIAWVMIIAGIAMIFGVQVPFFGTGFISGLWLAFIGWFLSSAASQGYRQVVIQEALEDVPIERIMRYDAPAVSPQTTLDNLVYTHMMGSDEQSFPVLKDEILVGIVTFDDVRKIPKDEWDQTTVQQVMTPSDQMIKVTPEEDASDALMKLRSKDVRQLPVVKNGRLIGMLRRRDILRWLQLHTNESAM